MINIPRQLTTSTKHLTQELLMNVQCRDGSRSTWEPWMWGVLWPAIGSQQWPIESSHWSWSSAWDLARSSMSTILQSFGIWSKLERWKSSISGCLMSWLKVKKLVILKCPLLSFCATTTNYILLRLWHMIKSGFYKTTSNDQLSGLQWSSKALSKAKLAPKTRSWSLFGGLLLVWSTTAFWILEKLLHLRSVLSKSMWCTKNGSPCSWHWSAEMA